MRGGTPLFVAPEWAPVSQGGIGRAIHQQALQEGRAIVLLDRSARDVTAAKKDSPEGIEILGVEDYVGATIPARAFRSEAFARSFRIWRALASICSRMTVSSIEFVDYDGPGYVSIKAKRLGVGPDLPKLSVRLHGTVERTSAGDFDRLLRLEDKQRVRMERYALAFAERIVAPSMAVIEEYAIGDDHGGREVSIDRPRVDPPVIRADVRLLGAPFKIGFLGKLQPLKGPATLVQAALQMLDGATGRDIEVHLIGPDRKGRFGASHEAELLKMIPPAARPRFIFHGHRPIEEAHRQLAECHAVVLPSRTETFGFAAHEVAMIGIPLALTEIAAFREGLSPSTSGSDAVVEFFGVDDADALSALLKRWFDVFQSGDWPPSAPSPLVASSPEWPRAGASERSTLDPMSEGEPAGQPLVSVVIPFFEMEAYLEVCLASLESDPYPNLEWIIVDDGSRTDGAREMLERLERRFATDGRHRIVRQSNAGLGAARNAGIREAEGDFVLLLDPDDLLVPGYVSSGVSALQRVPGLDYVVSISSLFDDGRPPTEELDWIVPYDPTPGMLMYENGAGTAAGLFRRAVLIEYPYREDLPAYEDWDLYLRLAWAGRGGEMLPMIGHRYRQRMKGLAKLAHRNHALLAAEVVIPQVARLDPEVASALEIYLASESRLRGLGRAQSPRVARFNRWVERIYRHRLKDVLRNRLGEERRDAIAGFVRRLLGASQ